MKLSQVYTKQILSHYPGKTIGHHHYVRSRNLEDRIVSALDAYRLEAFDEVLAAIDDMDKAYPEVGRKISRGEIVKWLKHEVGRGAN